MQLIKARMGKIRTRISTSTYAITTFPNNNLCRLDNPLTHTLAAAAIDVATDVATRAPCPRGYRSCLRLSFTRPDRLIGPPADLTMLKKLGVKTQPGKLTEVPVYDLETFETNVAGIYVAGHFTHARHIKAAIEVPRKIIPLLAGKLKSQTLAR